MGIQGQDFMFYVEGQTLTGSVMIPICEAKSVQLQFNSDVKEATKGPLSRWKSFYYGRNSYTLNLDGLIVYSDEEIQQLIIAIEDKLLETDGKLVSIGGMPVNQEAGYFTLEIGLFNWHKIKWAFNAVDKPIKWSGEVLVSQMGVSASPNNFVEFSSSLQGNGEPKSFHTPIPADLAKESQTNTLPTESLTILNITPVQQGSIWQSGFSIDGTPLPGGKLSTLGVDYTVQIGDDLPSIIQGLAMAINAALPSGVINAYADDDTLKVEKDNNSATNGTYTNHTGTLRSVGLKFSSPVNYDFYRIKVEQGANTWYIDVQGTNPTIILPTGAYTISVSGMGQDLQYSDYSETIQITIN